ncbi:MAG TPA: hypothetical protein VGF21_00310 [Thermoleophilaceae bacterium]|jgi:hypothetical protein
MLACEERSPASDTLRVLSVFCRHNRFEADCPICSKGTVLDSSRPAPRRPASRARGARKQPGATPAYKGPHASAGPYTDDEGSYEVRIEKVPGGLRMASWMAGAIRRTAPVLRAEDLPGLFERAAEAGVVEAALVGAVPTGEGTSPGRAGDLREELRVEALGDGRVRVARWILRPNRGWELQEAPVMLPASRYAEAFQRASG